MVRNEQMAVMRQSVRAGFAADVVAGLRRESPHAIQGLSEAEVMERVQKSLQHADRLQIRIERDLRAFIRLCFLVGADFAAHAPFAEWLDPAEGGGIRLMFDAARPADWERAAIRDVVDRHHEKRAAIAQAPAPGWTTTAALVPLAVAHAAAVHQHGLHPDVWRMVGDLPHTVVNAVHRQISEDERAPDRRRFAILDQASTFVGVLALEAQDQDSRLSYWIRRDRWGRGLATAAIGALLSVPPVFAGCTRLVADVLAGNLPSMGVLRRCGFVDEPAASSPEVRRFTRPAPTGC